jgi:hypothetical protein
VEVKAFLQKAAGAFSLPPIDSEVINIGQQHLAKKLRRTKYYWLLDRILPFHVPKGPYML